MALYRIKNGSYKIDYVKDGVKRTFTVGQVSKRAAESIEGLLESLLEAHDFRIDPSPVVLERVGRLCDRLQKSFDRHGLLPAVKPRTFFTVRQFCDEWLESKRLSVKAVTAYGYGLALDDLCEFVGKDFSVSSLSRSDVEKFHCHLQSQNFSPTTINHNFRVLRSVFADGVRRERLSNNPFDGYRAGSVVNLARREYIPLSRFQVLLEKIPEVEARAYLSFARYAGLRRGEINGLRFSDFSETENKFRIGRGKTGERFVPYFSSLRPYVEALRDLRDDDNLFSSDNYFSRWVLGLVKKTGLELWPKFFVNLRASCISDWDGKLSEFMMTSIFGNSQAVRNAHYIQLRGDEMERVVGLESVR
ncbi:MAG: tyrosine-type recombinase/integrase [Thermoguttaceae bacterium]